MSEIGTASKVIKELHDVTAQLLRRMARVEQRLGELSGVPVAEEDLIQHGMAETTIQNVSDSLNRLERESDGHHEAPRRPGTDLVARVNQALERFGAPGGYVDQLRRLETKMDKQAEDMHAFETIITELAGAVSHTLKTQAEVATKRDLLDTRGMLMVALDNLKQSLVFRHESVEVSEVRDSVPLRWVLLGFGAIAAITAALFIFR